MPSVKCKLDINNFQVERMLNNMGITLVNSLAIADVVVFTGGSDVDPKYYGEEIHPKAHVSPWRDIECESLYLEASKRDLPMIGICRGAQFLNVMNGGKTWQHVNNHALGGVHPLTDLSTGEVVNVTSTHHQMMRPHREGQVLAVAKEASLKENMVSGEINRIQGKSEDVEVVFYPHTRCLCFQPHPEYSGAQVEPTLIYFKRLLKENLPEVLG